MFCFLFIDFELLTLKNFRVINLGLVYIAQKDLINQIKLQIDQKTDLSNLNKPNSANVFKVSNVYYGYFIFISLN